jgi:hypothetical protein
VKQNINPKMQHNNTLLLLFILLLTTFLPLFQSRTLFGLLNEAKHDLAYAELFDPDTGDNGRLNEIRPFMIRYSESAVGNGSVYYLHTTANFPQKLEVVAVDKMQMTKHIVIDGTTNENRVNCIHYDNDFGVFGVFGDQKQIARVNETGAVYPLLPLNIPKYDAISECSYDAKRKRLFLQTASRDGYYIHTVNLNSGEIITKKLPSPFCQMENMQYSDSTDKLVGWYLSKFSALDYNTGTIQSFDNVKVPSDGIIVHALSCFDHTQSNYYQVVHRGSAAVLFKINTSDTTQYQVFPFFGMSIYILDFIP